MINFRTLEPCLCYIGFPNLSNHLWSELTARGRRFRNRLAENRIKGDTPIKRWDPTTQIDFAEFLEFGCADKFTSNKTKAQRKTSFFPIYSSEIFRNGK